MALNDRKMIVGPASQVILQPTPYCNLDCTYCYLPHRSNRDRMSVKTAVKAFQVLADGNLLGPSVDCRWHAGEPLVVSKDFYSAAIAGIEESLPAGTEVAHSLQTNGLLIDDGWIEFFARSGMRVGVSIDGPEQIHDKNRVCRNGRGTHARVMHAIRQLHAAQQPFEIIAVITNDALDDPDGIFAFFAELGATSIGFNIEESEGSHQSASIDHSEYLHRYRSFMERIYHLQIDSDVVIRELEDVSSFVLGRGTSRGNSMVVPFGIASIDCHGNLATFSPEFLGMEHPTYGDFVLGNVHRDPLEKMLSSDLLQSLAQDIHEGVRMCASDCQYFMLCGGGAPSNKLYENGTLRSIETAYCQTRFKIVTDIVLDHLAQDTQRSGEH